MSQHDMNISNQGAAASRSDLNNALAALASLSSGAAEPATKFENMLWYDTASKILKMRTAANDGWISLFYLDQTAGKFRMLENVQIVDASGAQKGLLGPQAEATWKAGVGTLESLITPAKLKAAIEELAPKGGMTAIGTQATDSGGTVAMSGLTLTNYKFLRVTFNSVKVGTIINSGSYRLDFNGLTILPSLTFNTRFSGTVDIDLANGIQTSHIQSENDGSHFNAGESGITTASTEIELERVHIASASGQFSAGEYAVYGVK